MGNQKAKLDEVSLISANFGNGVAYRQVLNDWFAFLGGKPGEVVIVDGGSDAATQRTYWDLYQEGIIDKLQIINAWHQDNDKERCFIQEYTAASIASKPYLLFFKIDTLPYRRGHDAWLAEAIEHLDREDVFAVSGALNRHYPHRDAWKDWYFSHACTINFALMKRSTFVAAMQEFAGDYISSGFQGEHKFGRFLLEIAFVEYMERHKSYTLCRVEDASWTVFHTNAVGKELLEVREKYFARENIDPYLNPCLSDDISKFVYYGKPIERASAVKRVQMAFGKTQAGAYWRNLKQRILAAD
jgi:hypothetical protein